jgi:hypothetical protein
MTKEALRLALEALETLMIERGSIYEKAITAIKAALEAKDEPYGYVWFTKQMEHRFTRIEPHLQMDAMNVKPVYTTPPQRTWVGLTDEDRFELAKAQYGWEDLLFAAEAKFKQKNT